MTEINHYCSQYLNSVEQSIQAIKNDKQDDTELQGKKKTFFSLEPAN